MKHLRPAMEENRRVWSGGDPSRADARLRCFARSEGDAVFCRLCDGQQYIVRQVYGKTEQQPVKCSRCHGEGLEP